MFVSGLDLHMAILGAEAQVSAACRLDEIEILVEFMFATDNRLRLDCVIVNTDPMGDEEMLLMARSAAMLENSGYEVRAVNGELEYSLIRVDEVVFESQMLVPMTATDREADLTKFEKLVERLWKLPELGIPLYSDAVLFPDEYEEEAEFEERLKEENRTVVEPVRAEVLKFLASDPNRLFGLSPREFEEVIAELFQRWGFAVDLTPLTRDGGRDVLAKRSDDLGESLFLIECKRYARERLVGVDRVRSLYGVVMAETATAGIVVTTSSFSRDAIAFADNLRYRMTLRDFGDLSRWLRAHA